jgi:hypothetical protein
MGTLSTYRWCVKALLICLLVRLVGLVSMATLLAPGLDFSATPIERAVSVSQHPWLWRLGWLPWQMTAVWDVLLSLALAWYLFRVKGRPGLAWAVGSVVAASLAFVPDQWAQYVCVTSFVSFAQAAASGHVSPADYVATESRLLLYMGTFGCAGYTVMGWAWMKATLRSHTPTRWFEWIGKLCWALFGLCALANWYSTSLATPQGYPLSGLLFALNAVAFPLLSVWMVLMAVVLGAGHHLRHPAWDREWQDIRWPVPCPWKPLFSPGLRDLIRAVPERLRFCALASDITDVVYLNWLVPVQRVGHLLPPGLEFETRNQMTCLSVLTYRHGRFGPRFLGSLRRFFPSPCQSNWRFYLKSDSGEPGIYFIKSVQSQGLVVTAARVLSDGLPSHMSDRFQHRESEGDLVTSIDPGDGSAPDLRSRVRPAATHDMPEEWCNVFDSPEEAVTYLVTQSKAVRTLPAWGKVCHCYIDIPIDPAQVVPAQAVAVESRFLEDIVKESEPFCFVVPSVAFQALGERYR